MTVPRRLYDLLPELYRRLDAQHRHALRELTEVLDVGRAAIKDDTDTLYRDWFVETAGAAALDRIAILVGASDRHADTADHRAIIADAVAYRRREGTRSAAETRLRDVSGWPVAVGTPDKHGSVAIEVWRRLACRSALHSPAPMDPGRHGRRFRLHPFGIDIPLYQVPERRPAMGGVFVPALDAPLPLTVEVDAATIGRTVDLQVADAAGAWHPVAPERIVLTALGAWTPDRRPPANAAVAIDPDTARLMILDDTLVGRPMLASFGWVPPGTVGGGSYDRPTASYTAAWVAEVDRFAEPADAPGRPRVFSTLSDALTAFRAVPGCGLIRMLDSATHDIGDVTIDDHADVCRLDPDAPRRLVIDAVAGETPVIRGRIDLRGAGPGLDVTLDGLWIDGTIACEERVALRLTHCTLHACSAMRRAEMTVPAVKTGETDGGQHVTIIGSLVGPLDLAPSVTLECVASVIDGYGRRAAIAGRPDATFRRSTVIGEAELGKEDGVDTPSSNAIGGPDSDWRSLLFGQPDYARRDRHEGDVGCFGDQDERRMALLQRSIADILPAGQRYTLTWR